MGTGRLLIFMGVMLLIFAGFYFFIIPGERQLLDTLVSTGPEITLDDWLFRFETWAMYGLFFALGAGGVWYCLGQWVYRPNHWTEANSRKRWIWLILLLLSMLVAAPGDWLTPRVQEWGRLSTLLYAANNFFAFYILTVFFSPASFKYMPIGAVTLRRW